MGRKLAKNKSVMAGPPAAPIPSLFSWRGERNGRASQSCHSPPLRFVTGLCYDNVRIGEDIFCRQE
jgi:hypothetical protein